ncbi:MAG: hypothetical protein JKY18_11265, partial [Flavobacteriales bacterium]|nr:hypothetical protein [Flavobacteriales bacterium]
YARYKGHANYVSRGLKTGINFQQFKDQVKKPADRKYMPFFLFDLRDSKVTIEGSNYEWAVRIEDYRYEDSQQHMAATALRLMNTISAHIGEAYGKTTKGIIVLATNLKATPNTSIAGILNKNGYPNLTRSQLLATAGGKKAEVLNPGIGIGYLRYIRDDATSLHPDVRDILIYESLPKRVPPVSGIITLEPQTPLSHINLLAKNRGTINISTIDLKYIPGAGALIDKLVKITCTESRIQIMEIEEKEAEKFWAARIVKVDIPRPFKTIEDIVDLNESSSKQTTQHIGAKASNYALIRQQFPAHVRPGFAIPFAHYFNTLVDCGADTLIDALVSQKPAMEERNKQLKEIRDRIRDEHLSPALIKEINKLIEKQFGDARIRLRSSTNCEDLPEFNGAGLYLSKGFNIEDGDKVLCKKIRQVYASLWSPLAFEEREFYFIDHSKVGMAILINGAFPEEYANGVALTMVDNKNISIYINSQYGENSVTNPENGQIPESLLYSSSTDKNYVLKSKSNIHDILIQDELNVHLNELKRVLMKIHQLLTSDLAASEDSSYGVDIEFKLLREQEAYKLYIKQARLLRIILPN